MIRAACTAAGSPGPGGLPPADATPAPGVATGMRQGAPVERKRPAPHVIASTQGAGPGAPQAEP